MEIQDQCMHAEVVQEFRITVTRFLFNSYFSFMIKDTSKRLITSELCIPHTMSHKCRNYSNGTTSLLTWSLFTQLYAASAKNYSPLGMADRFVMIRIGFTKASKCHNITKTDITVPQHCGNARSIDRSHGVGLGYTSCSAWAISSAWLIDNLFNVIS